MGHVPDHVVDEALSLIQNESELPHPLGPLLKSFISEALQPRLAAAHVLQRCRHNDDQKAALIALISDWMYIVESMFEHGASPPAIDATTRADITSRDGAKCCITGKAASYADPLMVIPVLPIPSQWLDAEPRIFEMLGAFFSPPYRDWWLSYAQQPDRMSPYHSHWLVKKSAAKAFERGLLILSRLLPSMIEYRIDPCLIGTTEKMIDVNGSYPLLGDHSRAGLPKVDARFVGTHARMAPSVRWIEVHKHIASDATIPSSFAISNELKDSRAGFPWFPRIFRSYLLKAWHMVPTQVRLMSYKILQRLGKFWYGGTGSFSTQRLPFGLYLKSLRPAAGLRNEANALTMIRHFTEIPVPEPLDLISVPAASPDALESEYAYLLTSRLPGLPLASVCDMLSDRDAHEFVTSMQGFLPQMRAIPKTINPAFGICNTLGEACRDPRIRCTNPVGPFEDEAAFSQLLRYPDDPARRGHDIVLTHADLNLRNILVGRVTRSDGTKGWKVVGIVDWENSGFFPEYWECTKALFEGWRFGQRWCNLIREVFNPFGGHSKELELEKRSWAEGDAA